MHRSLLAGVAAGWLGVGFVALPAFAQGNATSGKPVSFASEKVGPRAVDVRADGGQLGDRRRTPAGTCCSSTAECGSADNRRAGWPTRRASCTARATKSSSKASRRSPTIPIAVYKGIDNFENGDISVRFQMVGGTLDRCAGILFNVKPNGDYLTVRFNGTEDNVVLWTFNKGVRKFVKRAPELVPLELGTWHTLKISVHGTLLQAYLDGKLMIDYTLTEPVSGKIGVWSKTDSMIEFDDFTVTPAAK